jgi:hypothetical protein
MYRLLATGFALLLSAVLSQLTAVAGQNGLNTTKPASMPDADFQRYREELQQTPGSALAHFRMSESFFEDRNFEAAANEFRAALNGDPHPNWIDAWADIDIGKILTQPTSEVARSENIKKQSERGTIQAVPKQSPPRAWTAESTIQFCTVSLRILISRIE